MRILLDTHIALWAVADSGRLSEEVTRMLEAEKNEIYYSVASVWEIAIKHMLHPDRIRINGSLLERGCEENGYLVLPVFNRHVSALETLRRPGNAPSHKDPFDRIMVAQAKAEHLMFLTHDSLIPYYNEQFIISV